MAPNTFQYTLSAIAVSTMKLRRTKLLLCIPPGQGKSRVAATIMYLAAHKRSSYIKQIRYVFTHVDLMNVEKEALEMLESMTGLAIET